jgi:ABC-type phosphate transport system substrate-binding protein
VIKLSTSAVAAASFLAASSLALAATTNESSSMARSGSSTAGISKTQAMKEIQLDGYTNVQDLHKAKGGWMANAMEGGKQVSLRVDNRGGIRKE